MPILYCIFISIPLFLLGITGIKYDFTEKDTFRIFMFFIFLLIYIIPKIKIGFQNKDYKGIYLHIAILFLPLFAGYSVYFICNFIELGIFRFFIGIFIIALPVYTADLVAKIFNQK